MKPMIAPESRRFATVTECGHTAIRARIRSISASFRSSCSRTLTRAHSTSLGVARSTSNVVRFSARYPLVESPFGKRGPRFALTRLAKASAQTALTKPSVDQSATLRTSARGLLVARTSVPKNQAVAIGPITNVKPSATMGRALRRLASARVQKPIGNLSPSC